MAPKLRDVIEKIMRAGKLNQSQLAAILYGSEAKQGKISTLTKVEDGSSWEKHWQVLSRLVILGVHLRVITERDLLEITQHDPTTNHGGSKAGGTKDSVRR